MTTADKTVSGGSSTSSMREELSDDANRLSQTAKDRANQEIESRKGQAAGVARSTSSALDKAAGELEKDQQVPGWLSSAFRQAASSIERMAGEVEGRSPDQIGREVNRFARQHPGSFLAASAAAGFAAARFLRAGAEYESHHSSMGGSTGSTSSTGVTSATRTGGTPGTTGTSAAAIPVTASTTSPRPAATPPAATGAPFSPTEGGITR